MKKNKELLFDGDVTPPLPRFKSQWNVKPGDCPGDFPYVSSESLTVPDQAVTPAELLKRNSAGMSLSGKQPIYNSVEIPNLAALDLVDIEIKRDELRESIHELEERHRELSKQQADAYDVQRKTDFEKMFQLYEEKISSKATADKDTTPSN